MSSTLYALISLIVLLHISDAYGFSGRLLTCSKVEVIQSSKTCPIFIVNKSYGSSRCIILNGSSSSSRNSEESDSSNELKQRLRVEVMGPHATNALFRAELKKELTFYRGCSAFFAETGRESAVILAEGRTMQLQKFLGWLKVFGTELNERKPNFQGPSLIVRIVQMQWEGYTGDLKGFMTANEAPEISSMAGIQVYRKEGGVMEAGSMAGTDESV